MDEEDDRGGVGYCPCSWLCDDGRNIPVMVRGSGEVVVVGVAGAVKMPVRPAGAKGSDRRVWPAMSGQGAR